MWIVAESNSFVLLRFAEHRNEIEIGDFFLPFIFPFQKIAMLNLE